MFTDFVVTSPKRDVCDRQ